MTEYPPGPPKKSRLEVATEDLRQKQASFEETQKRQVVVVEAARGRLFFFAILGLSVVALNGMLLEFSGFPSDMRVLFFFMLGIFIGVMGVAYGLIQYEVAKRTSREQVKIEDRSLAELQEQHKELKEWFGHGPDWDVR